MTICIGALCADSEGKPNQVVIAAADRMVTLGGFIEFEHEIPKAMELAPKVVGLMAGDAIKGSLLQREVRKQLPAGELIVQDIADQLATLYVEHRRRQLENELFRPRGFGIQDFYGGLIQRLPTSTATYLDTTAAQFDFAVDLLIAGVDANGGHILRVSNPGGSAADFEQIGFHAIGSGTIHAMQTFIAFSHNGQKRLPDAIYSAYVAKRRAEVAPGVGKDTDMLVITQTGVHRLSEAHLQELQEIFEESEPLISPKIRAAVEKTKICQEVGQC